jgi:Fe2+ or Zn2+ uptake regulation protein
MDRPVTTPEAPDEARLREALERCGFRCTRQRSAVYACLRATACHPTAEMVFAAVRQRLPHISLATVYKALETLVEARVALRLADGPGPARYDGRSDAHYHFRCARTGQVVDVPLPYDPDLLDKLAPRLTEELNRRGFLVTGHKLELTGELVARAESAPSTP